jgi:hypothetical protein
VALKAARSDVVAEQDLFECKGGAVRQGASECEHCSFRYGRLRSLNNIIIAAHGDHSFLTANTPATVLSPPPADSLWAAAESVPCSSVPAWFSEDCLVCSSPPSSAAACSVSSFDFFS